MSLTYFRLSPVRVTKSEHLQSSLEVISDDQKKPTGQMAEAWPPWALISKECPSTPITPEVAGDFLLRRLKDLPLTASQPRTQGHLAPAPSLC